MKAHPLPARLNGAIAAALLALAGIAPAALAQAPDAATGYPPQQIRFVVPFTAGGGTDVIARIMRHIPPPAKPMEAHVKVAARS